MTLTNLTYPQLFRSLNIPSEASHVLDHFNGSVEEVGNDDDTGEPVFGLVHNDDDIDSTADQEHAACILLWESRTVERFLAKKGADAFGFLKDLGFTDYQAASLCWDSGIQNDRIRKAYGSIF